MHINKALLALAMGVALAACREQEQATQAREGEADQPSSDEPTPPMENQDTP